MSDLEFFMASKIAYTIYTEFIYVVLKTVYFYSIEFNCFGLLISQDTKARQ